MYKDREVIKLEHLGKMYKLYNNPKDKIKDAFGLNFYKKNYYKEFWALRDISLTINKGERVGFIGHNGAGKSTLLKTVIGNIQPTEGVLKVGGKIQALLELGTGFHPEFTGRENIRASLAYQGLNAKQVAAAEEEIIEFTELGEYIEQPVRTYSAGMYARLAFATTTVVCPEILIIDEVLGVGDAYFNGKCVERMRKLTSEEGTTVLFVSHDLQSIQNLCNRVIWIDKGRVRFDGDPLTAIKLYTQSVRKNEEMRLKLRDMKKSNSEAMVLDRNEDLYNKYLFSLKYTENAKNKKAKIYSIDTYADEELVASIDVGAPMDNNYEANNHIYDDVGTSNWGNCQSDGSGFYRICENQEGRYTLFQIAVSKEYNEKELRILFNRKKSNGDDFELELEVYNEEMKQYEKCKKGECFGEFYVIKEDIQTEEEEDEIVDNVETEDAKFLAVNMMDYQGNIQKVFAYENGVKQCEIDIKFKKKREHFVFVFMVYSMQGELILSTCQEVNLAVKLEEAKIRFDFPDMKIAPGEYVASIAVYDQLDVTDNTKEQQFLALLDRGVSFKIEKPMKYALNLGYFLSDKLISIDGLGEENIECNFII